MSWLDEALFGKRSKKQMKRETLAQNVRRGRAAEAQYVLQQRLMGREVERTGWGSDFRIRERDPWTGKTTKTYTREIKSSQTAPMSEFQKKSHTKKVVVQPLFY